MRLLPPTLALALGLLLSLASALPLQAQDRAGRDTASDWVVTHYTPFGLWDSICDERDEGGTIVRRCYLRYVEVFSPRPKFAAQFIFVTPSGVEIGLERGTRFAPDGMRIAHASGAPLHTITRASCLRGRACTFSGSDAAALLADMARGARFDFDFIDRHGQPQQLSWSLTRFASALSDYRSAARARGLLP